MTGLLITSNNGRTLKIQTEALPAFDPKRTWASRFCCDARLRPAILGIVPGLIEMQRREFIGLLGGDASLALCIGRTKRPTGRRTMRAIGLVLLSIAIMALLLTDADAKRRSSAQGSQAAGAKESWCATYPSQGINDNCAAISRSTSAIKRRSWAAAAFADPIRFRARLTGPATPGQVRSARAAAGLTDRRTQAPAGGRK